MAGNTSESGRSVASKIAAILMTFTGGKEHSLTEIAHLAELPISTTHRLAAELTVWRVLDRTADGRYRVGPSLRMVGAGDHASPGVRERARGVLEDLSAATRGRVRLGVLHGLEVAYYEKVPGYAVTGLDSIITLPLHCTAIGRALLAFCPPQVLDAVIARGLESHTPRTTTAPDRLRRALATIRLNRVAVCCHEYDPHSSAVAMPVFGLGGAIMAAIEVSVRDLPRGFGAVTAALTVATRSLSRELASGSYPGANISRPQGAQPVRPDSPCARLPAAGS